MKNARTLHQHSSLIEKYQLNKNPPAKDSLFWQMWHAANDIAQKALNTAFIQGIKAGNLDPIKYGAFNVADIYYCFNGADDYGKAVQRTTDPILRDYLQAKQNSYDKYNKSACQTWNLTGPESIAPTQTIVDYSSFETAVANGSAMQSKTSDTIYTLVVMLPCEYLWAWLAQQLTPASMGNLYADWITSNNYPEGAYAMGNFLQTYIEKHQVDQKLATDIYLQAMHYECKNFIDAV